MANIVTYFIIGMIGTYIYFRFLNKKPKQVSYSDILDNDNYKTKGQWDDD